MEYRSGPDRNHPEWAKPLAPLPEWLDSIEQLLKSVDRANARQDQSPAIARVSTRGWQNYRYLHHIRCYRMKVWRKWRSISRSEAARILGYASAGVIARIEDGCRDGTVRANTRRQRELAESRWAEPIEDRAIWLKAWRKRLGISQRVAARILGYATRDGISRIEANLRNPSWEKVLVAIDAEKAVAEGIELPG
ncbi:MAG: helix-turn-helix transcriptional regulator [Deltaproteobacteria bacterium]|jgi:DNA-binding XRE family transcriptional regulator|nr:helix-turn-helix transcriptional regulator [Deltaproteobacteria bacterium]